MRNLEDKFQAEFVLWFGQTWPEYNKRLFEVYNNPKSEAHGAYRKAMGMKAGVSDLILQVPILGKMAGLECKAPGSTWARAKIQQQFNWGIETIKQGGFYIMTGGLIQLKAYTTALINNDIPKALGIQTKALNFVKSQFKNKTIKF